MEAKSIVTLLCVVFCSQFTGSLKIISRGEWGARSGRCPAQSVPSGRPSHVVIHHSATAGCYDGKKCRGAVRAFQDHHIDVRKWNDIGYNFIIGEDGNIYEGRGWGKIGAHSRPYNTDSIGICVIGSFTDHHPDEKALKALKDLIAYALETNNLRDDYKLLGHIQTAATECPGGYLYEEIKKWPHWTSDLHS